MKEQEIRKKVIELSKKLKNKEIHVVLSSDTQYNKINDMLLTIIIKEQKLKCIYVSLNKEYKILQKRLNSLGIDSSKMYFIDGTGKTVKADNCTFLSGPHSLTELSLAITEAINTGKFDFLFFDSISTLLIYNTIKTTEKFSHYMTSKIRDNNLGSIIISLKKDKEAEKAVESKLKAAESELKAAEKAAEIKVKAEEKAAEIKAKAEEKLAESKAKADEKAVEVKKEAEKKSKDSEEKD